MRGNIVVLDTGALVRRKSLLDPHTQFVCPSGVYKEVKDRRSIDNLLDYSQFLTEADVSEESLKIANGAAELTGDADQLSQVDLSVIAAAVQSMVTNKLRLRTRNEVTTLLEETRGPALPAPTKMEPEAVVSSHDTLSDEVPTKTDLLVAVSVISGDIAIRNVCYVLGIPSQNLNGRETDSLILWDYHCK